MISLTQRKKRAQEVILVLSEIYPDADCTLSSGGDAWKLLEMTRLAAQCTDKRVNEVSVGLFEKYPTPQAMAEADISELEEIVKPCGLYHMKAKDLKESSRQIVEEFGGKVPDNMEDLLKLSGVGRKIANLILGDIYDKPGIVSDTHCIRISRRLGLTDTKDPKKNEEQLSEIIPVKERAVFCHRLVDFGRDTCRAKNPLCENCPFNKYKCKLD